MKNAFGQEITIGSIVGLGIRRGNDSEQRVGIVLELFEEDYGWHGRKQWVAKCAWYATDTVWSAAEGKSIPRPGSVMISKQKFRFFLLDEESLDEEILQILDTAYTDYMLDKEPSTYVAAPS